MSSSFLRQVIPSHQLFSALFHPFIYIFYLFSSFIPFFFFPMMYSTVPLIHNFRSILVCFQLYFIFVVFLLLFFDFFSPSSSILPPPILLILRLPFPIIFHPPSTYTSNSFPSLPHNLLSSLHLSF